MADTSASNNNSKRRRGLGIVTPNACTECRKKRAKCDGQVPCGRCAGQKGVECVYEVPVRQSKEHMRSEIEQLREQQKQSERVLAALVSNDQSDDVLNQLREGATLENITTQLENMSSMGSVSSGEGNITSFTRYSDHQAIGNALQPARNIRNSTFSTVALSDLQGTHFDPQGHQTGSTWSGWGSEGQQHDYSGGSQDGMNWSPDTVPFSQPGQNYPLIGPWHQTSTQSPPNSAIQSARDLGQETILGNDWGPDNHTDRVNFPSHPTWTTITSDSKLVEHLLALYFCWEYPTFASLNKEHFLMDFKNGNQRYCSSLLVNAILALGCRFSNQPNTRLEPDKEDTAGDHFFAEAMRLLEAENDRHVLTTIQAIGLMSIREGSCGRSSESIFLSGQSVRLAIEMGLHFEPESSSDPDAQMDHTVRSATFWGAYSLDQAWSISIGRLPHFSQNLSLATKPTIIAEVEASDWVPYTDDGAPFERSCTQPSNVRSVYKTFCELSEIVHKSLYTLFLPGSNVTGRKLLDIYTMYLNWYEAIPTVLRLGQNFTPSVLFVHMYYHYVILLLFRPFIKMDIMGSGISPRDVCSQAAEAISTLVNSYSKLYTLRRTPSFVPYFVLTSSITHLVVLGTTDGGPEKLHQGVKDLEDMKGCHGFAGRALDILQYLLRHWNINQSLEDDSDKKEDITELCRPSSTSMNQFCPNIQSGDVTNQLGAAMPGENPLFWPFPLQGRPLLGIGDKLEPGGFKLLP